ncbi:unnamed protein product [Gongylonema pulchrum]|uniref:Antithrombin-III n=1 Tax=Gongylonema pulchrum TaxID=637853 RepID=A0A183DYA7_9BILA|nr:unnamed protein product [Gongylonema pulchrum]
MFSKLSNNRHTVELLDTPVAPTLIPSGEISFEHKEHTIVIEPSEAPKISPYFVPDQNITAKDMDAEINFNTPFLYMVVSNSPDGNRFVVSIGRFTNIQETNRQQPLASLNFAQRRPSDINNNTPSPGANVGIPTGSQCLPQGGPSCTGDARGK